MPRFASRTLLVSILLLGGTQLSLASDWPQFRGPTQTGVAVAGSAATWPETPALDVEWKVNLGPGYSSLIAVDGVIYTGWAEGESDLLGAFDAATGSRKWTLSLGDRYAGHDGSHDGPIATPAVATIGNTNLVFAMGGHGRVVAATTEGKELWHAELSEMGKAPFYGFTASPIVAHGDSGRAVLVMEVASGEGPTVVGFDPLTGKVLWQTGDDEVQYQSPVALTLDGVRQVVASGVKNLYGLDPSNGEVLWTHEYGGEPRAMGPPSNVPVHLGNGRLLVKPEAQSSTALAFSRGADGWRIEADWTSRDLSFSYVPAVPHGGRVFGYKRGFLVAVDSASGETVWRSRPPGDGFLAVADGYLVVATKKGSLHLATASAEGWNELASLDLFDAPGQDNAVWSDPIVAGGAIYVRSMSHLARVAVRTSAEDVDTTMANVGRGAEPPTGAFAEFLKSTRAANDKAAAVEAFIAARSASGGFPIVENGHVIFVFQTDEDNAGIEGAMLGERTQGEMRSISDTDLYYFVSPLPRDAWAQYRFVPGLGEPVLDPLNERQTQVMGFRGPQSFSYITMPDWNPPAYLTGEPLSTGTVVHHDVPLPAEEVADSADSQEPPGEEEAGSPPITSRGIDVYLPHDYDEESDRAYPVVFIHSAHMLREPMQLDRALDHYVGHALPSAVIVLVGPHDPRPAFDMFGGAEAAAKSFFEQVVPFVEERYPVAESGPGRAYIGFSNIATQAIGLAFDTRSRVGRVAAIQPTFFDSDRLSTTEAAAGRQDHRATFYIETSPLTLRAEHEGWDVGKESRQLADSLVELGYEVVLGDSNLSIAISALQGRIETALAYALTGKTEGTSEE
ncbi:MAG: PQQ-binding-like beta-propeller repeat protein [Thermoanaerobaculia bacterium]|nr:PQQ-binding-like beta-propeller repeat protein [Thermoanaerobaculia bacterium]